MITIPFTIICFIHAQYNIKCKNSGKFPEDHIPTIFETDIAKLRFSDEDFIRKEKVEEIEFSLWDTAGQESYDRLRPLSYPSSDVVLICFAIDR